MQDASTASFRSNRHRREVVAGAAATRSDTATADRNPPLLIGGLSPDDVGTLAHIGVDYLTVSVPDLTARELLARSQHAEEGYGRPGFSKSEQRKILGGLIWRRWEPHQASKAWGKAYESWEASGASAWWPAMYLKTWECRPSRLDVAWDFSCEATYTADMFHDAVKPWADSRGITTGISGHAGIHTRYIGAKTSDRFVRVYRKDLQDAVLAEILGPTLRVELVLKDAQAAAFWEVWKQASSDDDAWPAAAAVLHRMTGFAINPGECPQLEVPECKDEGQRVLAFVEQHGPTLLALHDAGLDVVGLCREHVAGVSKRTQIRQTQRVDELRRLGVAQVSQLVLDVIRSRGERRSQPAEQRKGA